MEYNNIVKFMDKDLLKQYVIQQLSSQANTLELKTYDRSGNAYPKRYIFNDLKKSVNDFLVEDKEPRWIIIPGLRGVGKTTILAQLFFDFRDALDGRILYVSMDDVVNKLNSNLFELLDAYEEIIGESFSKLKKKVLLLVDEAHYDPKWQSALKSLYDRSRDIFILTTGSSAIPLNINADIARRALIKKAYPLKFAEYAMLSLSIKRRQGLDEEISKAVFFSKTVEEAYDKLRELNGEALSYWQKTGSFEILKYLKFYSLPAVLPIEEKSEIYQILNGIIERIINKDIMNLQSFATETLSKMQAILFVLAGSDAVSFNHFANAVSDINIKTLMDVFNCFEKSELLLRVYPHGAVYKKIRKPSKFLFLAPALRAALLNVVDSKSIEFQHKGKLLEDAVGAYFAENFIGKPGISLSYDSAESCADFILEIGDKKIAIETGWNKKNAGQVIKTMKHIGADYGLLITDSFLKLDSQNKILTIPLEYFFLM